MAEAKRRGRPPGSKNKKGAPAAAPANASPGHNSMPEDQRKAQFFHVVGKANRMAAELAEAKKAFEAVLKEGEDFGFTKADIKWALKQQKTDPEKALAEQRRKMEYAKWLGLPIGTQMSLFEASVPVDSLEKAFDEGKTAGLKALTCISPYSPELEQSKKWIEGWHAGQEVHRQTFLRQNTAPLIPADTPAAGSGDAFDDALAAAAPSEQPAEIAPEPVEVAPAPAPDPREMTLETVGEEPVDVAPADLPSFDEGLAEAGAWPDGADPAEDVRPSFLINGGDDTPRDQPEL